jgi:hypothetical protein
MYVSEERNAHTMHRWTTDVVLTSSLMLGAPSPAECSLRSIFDNPPIPLRVVRFFDALEQLPARDLVAIAETSVLTIKHAVAECTRVGLEHGLRDPLDEAELTSCRWCDRRTARFGAGEPSIADDLTRDVIGRVQVLAQWVATAIVVRGLVSRDVYQLATAILIGLIPVPEHGS